MRRDILRLEREAAQQFLHVQRVGIEVCGQGREKIIARRERGQQISEVEFGMPPPEQRSEAARCGETSTPSGTR
jgi:hypothetical protein